jgi:hypothetical protein
MAKRKKKDILHWYGNSKELKNKQTLLYFQITKLFYYIYPLYYIVDNRRLLLFLSIISPLKRCSVRLYIELFVGGFMSYLPYLCLFACGGVQHILCVLFFCFFFFVLCPMCWQFLGIVNFWLALRLI